MSLLEAFLTKHDGQYNAEALKKTYTPGGKINNQIARGKLNYKTSTFHFWLNESGIDPLTIKTKTTSPGAFFVYPRGYWGSVFSGLSPNWKFNFPQNIHKQYQFSGDQKTIQAFRANQTFLNLIDGQHVSIFKRKRAKSNLITLIPTHGLESIDQLETLTEIIYQVQQSAETAHRDI